MKIMDTRLSQDHGNFSRIEIIAYAENGDRPWEIKPGKSYHLVEQNDLRGFREQFPPAVAFLAPEKTIPSRHTRRSNVRKMT